MIWTIAIICGLVWVLGFVTAYTAGGYIHLLLVTAVALLVVGAFRAGRRSEQRRVAARSRAQTTRGTKDPGETDNGGSAGHPEASPA